MTNATLWDELVSIALLGTERENTPSQRCAGRLGNMLEQLKERPNASKETSLLSASAMIELHRRAGAVATKYDAAHPANPCPPDESPECSFRAGVLLSNLIEDRNTDLLFEWLTLAKQHHWRPPSMMLPRLLELGSYSNSIRPFLIDLAGHRARWLAAHNNDWSYLLQAEVDDIDYKTVWETGTTNERVGAIKSLRKRDPAAALSLLTSTWSDEPPECRILFVAELQTNLSMDDESFLEEKALNDKRKEVREKAQELLVLLPQSRLVQRMIARIDPLITLKRFLVYSEIGIVSLPETCDKDMIRDGISIKPVRPNMGEKADWLMQMISVIPPSHWCERFELSAMKLTTIANNNKDWRNVLLHGWRLAAGLHRSKEWAVALIPLLMPEVIGLFECLESQEREEFFLSALKDSNGAIRGSTNAETALFSMVAPGNKLSRQMSKLVLDLFKKELTVNREQPYTVYGNPAYKSLPHLALSIDPTVAPEAFSGWRSEAMEVNTVRGQLDKFMATIQIRIEMNAELTKS